MKVWVVIHPNNQELLEEHLQVKLSFSSILTKTTLISALIGLVCQETKMFELSHLNTLHLLKEPHRKRIILMSLAIKLS